MSTVMANELDVKQYQPAYSMENTRIEPPKDKPFELVSPHRKHTFVPDVGSYVISLEYMNLEALSTI